MYGPVRQRKMFEEYRDHDWGPSWTATSTHRGGGGGGGGDDAGTLVEIDPLLDLVVVFAVNDPGAGWGSSSLSRDYADLQWLTPYKTRVEFTSNKLIWVTRNSRADLHLAPGVAKDIYDAIEYEEYYGCLKVPDIADLVVEFYQGAEWDRLLALVADYRSICETEEE